MGRKKLSFYTQLSDEELCGLIRNTKNKGAEKELYSRYSSYIDYWLLEFSFKGENDDLKQEALIAVWAAMQAYDSSLEYKFSTYAKKCVANRLNSYLRKKGNKGIDFIEPDVIENIPENGPSVVDRMDELLLLEGFLDTLGPLEREIVVKRIEQRSYDEIAQEFGIDAKKVDNTLYKIRLKLKDYTKNQRRKG